MAGFPGRQGREVDLVYKSFGRRIPREEKKSMTSSGVSDPDPHWFGSPGSVSVLRMRIRIRIRIQEQGNRLKFTNEPDF
jgi:hypothetical protein